MISPITVDQCKDFAVAWFRALDLHAPVEECEAMLSSDELNMHFPDGDIHDFAGFRIWYERVTHLFFDEVHTIRSIEVTEGTGDRLYVKILVRWQSGWWPTAAAASERIDVEVNQKWTLRRTSESKNAFGLEVIEYYVSDDFAYAPGSATLPANDAYDAQDLVSLNKRIGEMEQAGGEEAIKFFQALLSDDLIFRRANGKIVGKSKSGDSFISTLKSTPFSSRVSENIGVTRIDNRALVTLTVVGTFKKDGSVRRFRNVRLFELIDGNWTLEFWYNFEVTGMPDSYYPDINTNIRVTDDISFKLLGLVPLLSGSSILFAVVKSESFWSPAIYLISLFGALVTFGLFRWELRNIQICMWLRDRAADIERSIEMSREGQFYLRPKGPAIWKRPIGKTEAEKLIYGLTIMAWLALPWMVWSAALAKATDSGSALPASGAGQTESYLVAAILISIVTIFSMLTPIKTTSSST